MNEGLRRAVEALETGTREVRELSARSVADARSRLRQALYEAHTHLEQDDPDPAAPDEDIFGHLDRQSKDIADELRRIEELMRKRTGRQ